MKIKAVSIKQPWAGLIAAELKWLEIRSWIPMMVDYSGPTEEVSGSVAKRPYRGPLLIVSSLEPDKKAMGSLDGPTADAIEPYLLYGQALCLCNLVLTRPMTADDRQGAGLAIPYPNAVAWVLDDVRPLAEPFPVKGRLGLYGVEVPDHEIM